MTSLPLERTHGRTTSGVACHHRLWVAHTVERCWAWNNITSFGQHTWLNNLGRDMPSPPFDSTFFRTISGVACHHHRWTSSHSRTASGVACHHRPWTQTRSNNVGRGMPLSPLGITHGRTTLGVACHHLLWAAQIVERCWAWHNITTIGQHTRLNDVRRGIPSSPMGSKHGQTTLGVA